jgi:hypothetical protein
MPIKDVVLLASMLSTMAAVSGCTVTTTPDGSRDRCSRDTSVNGCGSADGYSCTGSFSPDESNASLNCSDGVPSGGETLYCCVDDTFVPDACVQHANVRGCNDGEGIGFSCTGTIRPDDASSGLSCGDAVPAGAETLYCCSAGVTVVTPSCSQDANVACTDDAIGYTCVGGDTPENDDPTTTCGGGIDEASGAEAYCCSSAAAAPSCDPDSSVTPGCPQGADGYTCTGGMNPMTDTDLLCDPGTATGGQDFATAFCCVANTPI